MRKLHVVGFTPEFDGLILSTRKGAKSGSFVVPIGPDLFERLDEAERLREGGDEERATSGSGAGAGPVERVARREPRDAPRPRRESGLTPREIQARLRAGRTIDEVAREAGVDRDWVERFAAPILAEQAQVVELARSLTYSKSRLGESAEPLGTSVAVNLTDRGLRMLDDEFAAGWSAYQVRDGVWMVRFSYASRGRVQHASWELDVASGKLTSRDRLASDLGYLDGTRRRRAVTLRAEGADAEAPTEIAVAGPPSVARRAARKPPSRTARSAAAGGARKAAATRKPPAKKAAPSAPAKATAKVATKVAKAPAAAKGATPAKTAANSTAKATGTKATKATKATKGPAASAKAPAKAPAKAVKTATKASTKTPAAKTAAPAAGSRSKAGAAATTPAGGRAKRASVAKAPADTVAPGNVPPAPRSAKASAGAAKAAKATGEATPARVPRPLPPRIAGPRFGTDGSRLGAATPGNGSVPRRPTGSARPAAPTPTPPPRRTPPPRQPSSSPPRQDPRPTPDRSALLSRRLEAAREATERAREERSRPAPSAPPRPALLDLDDIDLGDIDLDDIQLDEDVDVAAEREPRPGLRPQSAPPQPSPSPAERAERRPIAIGPPPGEDRSEEAFVIRPRISAQQASELAR